MTLWGALVRPEASINESVTAARGSAEAAANSANQAPASASAAQISYRNAANSATQASQSATAAKQSEDNAASSETNAASSERNAAQSASQASASAQAAETSKTNAEASAQAAETSKTNAASSVSAAKVSETNAAASATAAKASETNAASSASAAASSETNAAASATAAQQAVDGFGLQVGTTTTGKPGTGAAVEIQKNGTKYTANFTIPRGDVGPAGVTVDGNFTNPIWKSGDAADADLVEWGKIYVVDRSWKNIPNLFIGGYLFYGIVGFAHFQLLFGYTDNNDEAIYLRQGWVAISGRQWNRLAKEARVQALETRVQALEAKLSN